MEFNDILATQHQVRDWLLMFQRSPFLEKLGFQGWLSGSMRYKADTTEFRCDCALTRRRGRFRAHIPEGRISPIRFVAFLLHQSAHICEPAEQTSDRLHGENWRLRFLDLSISSFDLPRERVYTAAAGARSIAALELVVMAEILERWEPDERVMFKPANVERSIFLRHERLRYVKRLLDEP